MHMQLTTAPDNVTRLDPRGVIVTHDELLRRMAVRTIEAEPIHVSPALSPVERAQAMDVWAALSRRPWDTDLQIALSTGLSVSQVERAAAYLHDAGLIHQPGDYTTRQVRVACLS